MREVKKRIGSGPQARIRAEFKAHRRSSWYAQNGISYLYMSLARRWKRPLREIRHICRPDRYPAP